MNRPSLLSTKVNPTGAKNLNDSKNGTQLMTPAQNNSFGFQQEAIDKAKKFNDDNMNMLFG